LSIWESSYWKNELARIAARLWRRRLQQRWPEESTAGVEKELFIGFYIVRKLIESLKLGWPTLNMMVDVTSYPALGKPVTWKSRDDLSGLYDWTRPNRESRTLRFLCNQMIHSYVFAPSLGGTETESGLSGVFFSSQNTKDRRVYYMDLTELVRVLQEVANDDGTPWRIRWDEKAGDYVAADPNEP
jgi:hypothetical protein